MLHTCRGRPASDPSSARRGLGTTPSISPAHVTARSLHDRTQNDVRGGRAQDAFITLSLFCGWAAFIAASRPAVYAFDVHSNTAYRQPKSTTGNGRANNPHCSASSSHSRHATIKDLLPKRLRSCLSRHQVTANGWRIYRLAGVSPAEFADAARW